MLDKNHFIQDGLIIREFEAVTISKKHNNRASLQIQYHKEHKHDIKYYPEISSGFNAMFLEEPQN